MTTEDIQTNLTIEDLNPSWAEDGLPIFYANIPNICDVVENLGFQIYYFVGNNVQIKKQNINITENGKKVSKSIDVEEKNLSVFKVINNFVGRVVRVEKNIAVPDYSDVATLAHYNLPLIPFEIIEKLDQFFRLVDAQHGTESIVMLTFDLNEEGPEGWGILVPDQENTASHCNYDPHSIAEIKPDNVMIVGSVHSHPKMAAYASGTDHADQADFDGIHITFGWQKSVNNGATQYHIEMQMSGESYTLQPEDVFENFIIDKEPDPEVVQWASKVKKELPLHSVGGRQAPSTHFQPTTANTAGTNKTYSYSGGCRWIEIIKKDFAYLNLPKNSIIFHEFRENENSQCEICGSWIDHIDLADGSCPICDVPLVKQETPKEIIFEGLAYYCYSNSLSIHAPVYMFASDSNGSVFVMNLTSDLSQEISYTNESYITEIEQPYDDKRYMICCGEPDITTCKCLVPMYSEDIDDFSDYCDKFDIDPYDKNILSSCQECVNYHQSTCPRLVNLVESFLTDKEKQDSYLEASINSTDCKSYQENYAEEYYASYESSSVYYE